MKAAARLYAQFQPESYQLELAPDHDTMRASGTVTIAGRKVGRPNQRLTFHQQGIKVTYATITKHDKKGDQSIVATRINHHRTRNEVRLHTGTLLYAGSYTIYMEFEATVQDSMHGMYVCNYKVDDRKQKLISTQFESHSAREAFPCIDEPEAKATFDLTIEASVNDVVLSNMPVKDSLVVGAQLHTDGRRPAQGRRQRTTFETTPRMSTYLLAFTIGDLQTKSAITKHGITTSVWATKAHKPETLDFGLDVAVRALDFLTDYYGVDYPLKKCDHVALPDFAVSAMENWGMITYRESRLLADPESTSQGNRERIALVVSHELAHMWFGDLVTMKWWDDLWLNESFANVMEYVALAGLFPDWHTWDDFAASEGLSALRRDCIPGVQSVIAIVSHPDEISSIFDPSIVYAKGGRLLNMLMHYLGEATFRRGLKLYFDRYAYKNTVGNDLWQVFSDVSAKDIGAFMNPWLMRPGFPVIEVAQTGRQLELQQSHLCLDESKADSGRTWPVPLLANSADLPDIFNSKHATYELASTGYVQLNCSGIGHYIVHYTSHEHLIALAESARTKRLNAPGRLMLLHDSYLLTRSGKQSFASSLSLLDYYGTEDSGPVWDVIALLIGESRRFIDIDQRLESHIKAFTGKLIEQQYKRLGWEEKLDEPSRDTKLRATLIGLGVYAEHPEILAKAIKRFESYRANPKSVPNELRLSVFSAAVRLQAINAFSYLVSLYEETSDAQLKEDIAGALATTKSENHTSKLLARLQDSRKVRAQDVGRWLAFLMRNRYSRPTTWQWFRNNWDWIERVFAHDHTYDNFPRYVADTFSTQQLLDEYKAFFEPKKDQLSLTRNIAIGIEEITSRVIWLKRDLGTVQEFFSKYRQ